MKTHLNGVENSNKAQSIKADFITSSLASEILHVSQLVKMKNNVYRKNQMKQDVFELI